MSIPGRFGRVAIDDGGGFDDAGCVTDQALNLIKDQLDNSCKPDGADVGFRDFVDGWKSGTTDFTVYWDDTEAGQEAIKVAWESAGGDVTVRFRMEEGTGFDEYTALASVASLTLNAPIEVRSLLAFAGELPPEPR